MPPPKKPRPIDREYFVLWNIERGRWDIDRDSKSTSQFAYDKSTAIGLAIRDAQIDTQAGLNVVVKTVNNGAVRVEWSSP